MPVQALKTLQTLFEGCTAVNKMNSMIIFEVHESS
jgi:hypothetical protein